MDENMDNGELTFKKIGLKLKAAWLRILVYVLVAVIIVSSLMGLISAVGSERTYSAQVLFSNDYINKGMTPWETTLDISTTVKGSDVIDKALEAVGITGEEKTDLIPVIAKNLVVTANHIEDKDPKKEEAKFVSNFAYTITLEGFKEIGLSKDKTQALLDNICTEFVNKFRSDYSYKGYGNLISDSLVSKNNYIAIVEVLQSQINEAVVIAEDMAKVAPSFKNTEDKVSFQSVAVAYETLETELMGIKTYLAATGVMSTDLVPNELDYIIQNQKQRTAQIEGLDSVVKTLEKKTEEASKAISGSTSGPNVIISPDQKYYFELVNQLLDAQMKLAHAKQSAAYYEDLFTGYSSPSNPYKLATPEEKIEMRNQTNVVFTSVVDKFNSVTNVLNNTINEYNEEGNLIKAVTVSQKAKSNVIDGISKMSFLLVNILAVVIAFIVAMVVTNKKGKMVLKKAKAEAVKEEAPVKENSVEEAPVEAENAIIEEEVEVEEKSEDKKDEE